MSIISARRRAAATGLAATLVTAAVIGAGLPANASVGGSANAQAADVSIGASISLPLVGDLLEISAAGATPVVTVPATNGSNSSGVDLDLSAILAGATVDVTAVEATRTSGDVSATAAIAGASINVLGLEILSTGEISSAVVCPVAGAPTADANVAGLEIGGIAQVLVENVEVTADVAVSVVGLVGASVEVTVESQTATTADSASAAGLLVSLRLQGTDLLGGGIDVSLGTVSLAATDCARPEADPAVTASSVVPDEGPTAGGQVVTITGSGFVDGDTTVTFDGVPATGVVVVDGTSLTAVTPPRETAGAVDVVVSAGGVSADPLEYTYVAPVIGSVAPDEGPAAGGQSVTITGSGFVDGAGVLFDGVPATDVVVVDESTITAVTPAHAAGLVDVTVTLPGADATAPDAYTYLTGPVVVTASSVVPDEGPTAGGQVVTITGSGFVDGDTTVTFDGVPATGVVVVDGTSLTAVTPPRETAGAVDVVVSAGGVSADPLEYTYVAPVIGSVAPDEGPAAGGQSVTITGSGFVDGAGVLFDGVPATDVVVVDESTITAVTPAHAAGLVDVTVTLPGADATAPDAYTYLTGPVSLPLTGGMVGGLVQFAIGLMFIGGVAKLGRRAISCGR